VDVLATLATTAASVYIGFKTFGLLDAGITNVGKALAKVGVSAEAAAGGLHAMQIAAGVIGAVITVATLLYTAHAESVRQDSQAVNDFTDAMIRSGGVIDDNTVKEQANKLAKDGTLQAAKDAGYAIDAVTLASLGNVPAMAQVTARTDELKASWAASLDPAGKSAAALGAITKGLQGQFDASDKVVAVTKEGAKVADLGTQAYNLYTASQTASATTTGTLTTATLLSMTAAQQATSTDKSQIATIKALNATMDEEISRNLALAGATSGVDQAVLNMNTALKANKGTLNEHTQAGISDRQAIEAVAGSLQSQRDAQIKAGASTADATAKYQTASAALLDQTGKLDGTKSAAYKYLQQLLAIPPSVKTAITANTTQAVAAVSALQGYLDRLHDKSITLTVYQQNSVNKLAGRAWAVPMATSSTPTATSSRRSLAVASRTTSHRSPQPAPCGCGPSPRRAARHTSLWHPPSGLGLSRSCPRWKRSSGWLALRARRTQRRSTTTATSRPTTRHSTGPRWTVSSAWPRWERTDDHRAQHRPSLNPASDRPAPVIHGQ